MIIRIADLNEPRKLTVGVKSGAPREFAGVMVRARVRSARFWLVGGCNLGAHGVCMHTRACVCAYVRVPACACALRLGDVTHPLRVPEVIQKCSMLTCGDRQCKRNKNEGFAVLSKIISESARRTVDHPVNMDVPVFLLSSCFEICQIDWLVHTDTWVCSTWSTCITLGQV